MTASSLCAIIPRSLNSSGAEYQTRRSGRRPGESGTRAAIRAAAARQFAERGFDRTSLRSIAAEAEVDPRLVAHFFGTKQQLFVEVVQLPFDPAEALPRVFGGDPEHAGERFAEFVVGLLENPESRRPLVGLVRAATSEPEAARMVRELLAREILSRIVAELGSDDADLRASLVGSQVVGLLMARYIVRIEPLASLPAPEVAAAIAPNLQRYLVGPLPRS
jgi:AcrR family transcriptional regulator